MKKVKNANLILIISNIILVILLILCVTLMFNKNNIFTDKVVLKEMSVSDYDSQINDLNTSHEDYALTVQENKRKLATAITNQKVATSENATVDEMITNIGLILENGTKDADATADNITAGKTAYVDGVKIIGTGADNDSSFEQGKGEFTTVSAATGYVGGGGAITRKATVTHDLSSYEGYENFEINKNIFLVSTYARYSEDDDSPYTSATCNVTMTYDPSTGILTLKDTAYRLAIYYTLYIVS